MIIKSNLCLRWTQRNDVERICFIVYLKEISSGARNEQFWEQKEKNKLKKQKSENSVYVEKPFLIGRTTVFETEPTAAYFLFGIGQC